MTKILKIVRFLIIYSIPLAVGAYAIWYWVSGYEHLCYWYKGLYPYFYKSATWDQAFFTETVKSQGNLWCMAALAASVFWIAAARKFPLEGIPKLRINRKSFFEYLIILCTGMLLSALVSRQVYAADEVFSAINFASLPSFQSFSYYALPNNHLLFNLLNGGLFSWSNDLVFTGRMISMLSFSGVLCITWYFLKKRISGNWLRWSVILTLAVMFPAWGFSGQARGYEMLLFFSMLSFISLWNYLTDQKWYYLLFHAFGNVAGMLTVPSYMYWWAGLLLAAIIFMFMEKRMDKMFFRISFASVACTLIFYLPLLSFSGQASISDNPYVQSESVSTLYFLLHLNNYNYFNGLFYEWFCFYSTHIFIGIILVLAPAILLFYPENFREHRLLVIFYFSVLFAALFMVVFMKRMPFYRNLIAHGYMVLAFIILTIIPVLRTKTSQMVFALILAVVITFTAWRNYQRMPDSLYYYGVNETFRKLSSCKTDFRTASSVYLDDESFYWGYVLKVKYPDKSLRISHNSTSFSQQDYCILPVHATFPGTAGNYNLIETCDDFNIYKRK